MGAGAECKTPRQQPTSGMGNERRPVVQMSAYPLTAARLADIPRPLLGANGRHWSAYFLRRLGADESDDRHCQPLRASRVATLPPPRR